MPRCVKQEQGVDLTFSVDEFFETRVVCLCLSFAVPIFTVAIQSTAVLQLLDVPANVAILSKSPTDVANNNMTLATYRFVRHARAWVHT